MALLITKLLHYFPDAISCTDTTDPFSVDPADLPKGNEGLEEQIDIEEDQIAKTKLLKIFQ